MNQERCYVQEEYFFGSGDVSEGEVEAANTAEEETTSTNFTCGSHFYEEVEDTKVHGHFVFSLPSRQLIDFRLFEGTRTGKCPGAARSMSCVFVFFAGFGVGSASYPCWIHIHGTRRLESVCEESDKIRSSDRNI